jgi:hypothetical protein
MSNVIKGKDPYFLKREQVQWRTRRTRRTATTIPLVAFVTAITTVILTKSALLVTM